MKRINDKTSRSFLKYVFFFVLVCLFSIGIATREQVKADTYQDFSGNAENFYDTYTDRKMVFFPLDEVDGKIYFGSRGKTAASTAGTKFREIGWQFVFTNTRTKETGVIYYKRGGRFITEPPELLVKSSDGYTYTMYYIKLSQLKKRLSSDWLEAFKAGEVELKVNSVMTIVVNGVLKGSMDDYGNFSGKVYTTYDGIAGAAGWSVGAKDSLHSYFGKTIDGLFHTVKIINGNGIASTSGAGTYLYGTEITVKSTPQVGWQWNADRNSKWVSTDSTFSSKRQNAFYTVGSKDVTLVVQASKNQYTICYQDGGTVSSVKQVVNYGDTVTLPTLAGSGLSLGDKYTYDSSKAWVVVRKSDNAIYASGWKTGWQNGGIAQSAWSKYKEGFSFPVNTIWMNATGNPHGDDTFYFYLQKEKKPIPVVTVVFHKNYAGQTDETYTETYYEGVANQFFGMKLSSDAANWVYWNKSPDGYYLPGDGSHGGGWSENKNDTSGDYGLTDKVQDAWIRQMNGKTIHLYMIRPPKKLTVVFHKNYAGQTDETYSETYTYGLSNQKFGMKLSSDAANWVYWNQSPEGYYLPNDTANGGGWAKDKNSYTRNYTLSSSVSNAFILQHADQGTLHLYMVRPPKKILVVFHKNDGTTETYSETYTYGVDNQYFGMNLSTRDAYFLKWKRSGYSGILGWARTATATSKNYNTSEKVANAWIVANEPKIDLYALWGSSIQITVNPNGGIWKGSESVQQFTLQKGEILSLPYPSRTGYIFVGWTWNGGTGEGTRSSINGWTQTEEAQTGSKAVVSYNSSETYTSYTYNVASPVTTDAWNRLTVGNYTITAGHTYRISGRIRINSDAPVGVMVYHGAKSNDYMNSKGTLYGSSDWQEFSYDRTFDAAGTGWFEFVSTNFKGKSGTLKIDLENLMVLDVTANAYMVLDQINSPMNNATNLAVTAHWKGNEVGYKVYHNQMNVSGEGYTLWKTESKTGIAGSVVSVSDVVLSPTGFTKPTAMTVDNQSVSSTIIKGDGSTRIYLYYDRNQYEVTLKAGTGILGTTIDGTTVQSKKVYYGAKVSAGAEVKSGYAWDEKAKWSGTYTSPEQNYTFTMPAKNVTLTANASVIYYNITYHLDGGTVSGNPDTYTVEDSFTLKNPEKTGNRFCGWTGSNGSLPQTLVTIEKGTTGDLTYYANWELLEFYFNVNGFLNGTDYDKDFIERLYDVQRGKNIAVFDVSVKKPGETAFTKVATKVTEYSKLLPYGTQWKIENVTAQKYTDFYYAYNGVKAGEKGEKSGSLSGTIKATTWENLIFTSYHKLRIGGYCDDAAKDSVEGYGTFDVKVSGKTALGTAVTENGADVTIWEKYYPYNSSVTISDIKKDSKNISNEKYADISYEGIYDFTFNEADGLNHESGKFLTGELNYSEILREDLVLLLKFNSWYRTYLDQQDATELGTEEVWHIFGKQAYYNEAGEFNLLEELVIPRRKGFVFQGYYTEKEGKGILYIDTEGKVVNPLYMQKKNQTLFAYWSSMPPIIQAMDSYFTLKEAQEGKITKELLLTMAKATDAEEGELQEGGYEGSFLDLENYDENNFVKLKKGAAVPVYYVAVDMTGNTSRCRAIVYIVDTTPQIINPSGNQVRFISKKYLEKENLQGGLLEGSIWKKEDYYDILWACEGE